MQYHFTFTRMANIKAWTARVGKDVEQLERLRGADRVDGHLHLGELAGVASAAVGPAIPFLSVFLLHRTVTC